jgi:transcriptional regulator with XRE-family HTH domain
VVISAIGYRVLELALGSSAATNMAQFSNYLRSNRKRLALSQGEVAFLLGTQSGAKVCRYERFVREPSLETALAFEAIFQRPVSELFGGLYQKVQAEVAVRAKTLTHKIDRRKPNRQTALRHQMLTDIASKPFKP